MTRFRIITAIVTLAGLASPSLALADATVASCCVLTAQTSVSACYQFSDTLPGTPTDAQKAKLLEFQRYKCQNIPYLVSSHAGKTARVIDNNTCGAQESSGCNGAGVTQDVARARCTATGDCGASAYTCEENLCKLRSGIGCYGANNTQVNCVNGTVCKQAESSSTCQAGTPVATGATTTDSNGGGGVLATAERVMVDAFMRESPPFTPIVPELGVPIPGFEFTPANETDDGIQIPYMAEYVNAIYRYMTAIVLVIAIVMIVYGGFRYLLAATPMHVSDGKKIITDALIGMVLVLSAYVILNTINPQLTRFQPLVLQNIPSYEVQLSLQFGGMADEASPDEAGDLSSSGGGLSATPAPAGSWRANALAACGDSNVSGMSLSQKRERLKSIVQTWTDLASTQKGSIYIRGGSLACSPTSAEYPYKAKILKGIKRAGYSVNVSDECLTAETPADSCKEPLSNEYKRLAATPGNANGVICGDCASYQRSLMKCFGGNAYAQPLAQQIFGTSKACENHSPTADEIGYIQVNGSMSGRSASFEESDINALIGRLQFGDILMWSSNSRVRHVLMYTGKAGLPYEIVEMGAGGGGDVIGGSDGKPYWARVGLGNFDGSHVKAHRSAFNYIKTSKSSGAKCYKALRVIDN